MAEKLGADHSCSAVRGEGRQAMRAFETISRRKLVMVLMGIVLLVVFLFALFQPVRPPKVRPEQSSRYTDEERERTKEEERLAHRLAAINAGGFIEEGHPNVAEFRATLNSIEEKTAESREVIVRDTVAAHRTFQGHGVKMGLLEFMWDLNRSIPEGGTGKVSFAKFASYHAFLRTP